MKSALHLELKLKLIKLISLRLNGGDFNKDPLRPLIENIGKMGKDRDKSINIPAST